MKDSFVTPRSLLSFTEGTDGVEMDRTFQETSTCVKD